MVYWRKMSRTRSATSSGEPASLFLPSVVNLTSSIAKQHGTNSRSCCRFCTDISTTWRRKIDNTLQRSEPALSTSNHHFRMERRQKTRKSPRMPWPRCSPHTSSEGSNYVTDLCAHFLARDCFAPLQELSLYNVWCTGHTTCSAEVSGTCHESACAYPHGSFSTPTRAPRRLLLFKFLKTSACLKPKHQCGDQIQVRCSSDISTVASSSTFTTGSNPSPLAWSVKSTLKRRPMMKMVRTTKNTHRSDGERPRVARRKRSSRRRWS